MAKSGARKSARGLLGIASGGWDAPWVAKVLLVGCRGTRGLGSVVAVLRSWVFACWCVLDWGGFALCHAAGVGNAVGDTQGRSRHLRESRGRVRVRRSAGVCVNLLKVTGVAV